MPRSRRTAGRPLRGAESEHEVRAAARAYEAGLPADQRKRLGQFFTGMPLGRLLAHLALSRDTRTVLDPMAGHGDLLDATAEAANARRIQLEALHGIEVDEPTAAACSTRLRCVAGRGPPHQAIIPGDAFGSQSMAALGERAYDLVITNPPYVRYQAQASNGHAADTTRAGLKALFVARLASHEREIFSALADGYSGLADLSVPAWLLTAALVRPGGRLALVVPATWRSRDYADVIRYLMLRCFCAECVVEDGQPGWFSDALVRTHLIVARRLTPAETATPLHSRTGWPSSQWLEIAERASDQQSLVGAAFETANPEADFAAWVYAGCVAPKSGIRVREFRLQDEWGSLEARAKRRRWYQRLEGTRGLPLFSSSAGPSVSAIPYALQDLLPGGLDARELVTLQEAGIEVGQGLRTGCNQFFYVTACGDDADGMVLVEASALFRRRRFKVPYDAIRPVLRRQSETAALSAGTIPAGRVLVLRNWVLPEDLATGVKSNAARAAVGRRVIDNELAAFIRAAAALPLKTTGRDSTRIPELSAVRTNVRHPRNGKGGPSRFWYMLPDFAPRHLPAAFVPRINHGVARVESNLEPAILIDANFSTFWAPGAGWTRHALRALLNSAWCRAFMEALGTPLGGGALKLEATHLRQMLIPRLDTRAHRELDAAGKRQDAPAEEVQARIDEIVLRAVLRQASSPAPHLELARAMTQRADDLSRARQRAA